MNNTSIEFPIPEQDEFTIKEVVFYMSEHLGRGISEKTIYHNCNLGRIESVKRLGRRTIKREILIELLHGSTDV